MSFQPTLNFLRSFQVIGKHLNLARASEELNLTPSALSHQLGTLESQLGLRLFTRTGRGLAFTDKGRDLHEEVDACLARLGVALRNARSADKKDVLVVSSMATIAMRWLLPRFASFQKAYASIEIRISAQPIDFQHNGVDCAIYYGSTPGPGLGFELLRKVSLIVACAPSAITRDRPLNQPSDLSRHHLLRVKSGLDGKRLDEWGVWFESVQMAPPPEAKELMLENRNLVIEATKSGLGVAVLDPLMIQDELASGALVRPLGHTAKARGAYYLVYPSTSPPSEKVAAFRDWLFDELQKSGVGQDGSLA